jgi:DNA-binding NtrC family response regulator
MRKILVVDDDPNIAEVIGQYFDRPGYDVCTLLCGEKVPETVSRIKPDLILLDLTLPDVDGMEVLKNLKQIGSRAPVVIITGNVSAEVAMETTREGAYEYLPKPFSLDQLGQLADKLLAKETEAPGESDPEAQPCGLRKAEELVGRGPEMLRIGKTIGQAALSDAPILLSGEKGTGKKLVARLIHQNSGRKDKPFVVLSCSHPSPEMVEEELFGSIGHASLDAQSGGRLEQCNGGTILLDGIENLSPGAQSKLLGFLKAGQIDAANVRIIASSSQDLSERMSRGAFMQELFYSLRVISIHIPALRERRSDIPLLAEYFLNKYCEQSGKTIAAISADAMRLLMSCSWPGNVEELENNLYSAVVMCQGDQILPEHLPISYDHPLTAQLDLHPSGGDWSGLFLQVLEPLRAKLFQDLKGQIQDRLVGSLEKSLISMALDECQGNQVKASDLLGISRNTLREKMSKFGLSKKEKPRLPVTSTR